MKKEVAVSSDRLMTSTQMNVITSQETVKSERPSNKGKKEFPIFTDPVRE
jgi:hypothetical protein